MGEMTIKKVAGGGNRLDGCRNFCSFRTHFSDPYSYRRWNFSLEYTDLAPYIHRLWCLGAIIGGVVGGFIGGHIATS